MWKSWVVGYSLFCFMVVSSLAQPSRENNTWYVFNQSDTTYVFVHGIFSNSSECWTAANGVFWPDLVAKDTRFNSPSIFLGGYYTDFSSGIYRISDAANELLSALRTKDAIGRAPPMSKRHIVFIAHSTGGLVVRYMLERYKELFTDTTVGLVLLASPSKGSAWANRLKWIREFFNNKMAGQLARDNDAIIDLDSRFADLIRDKKLPRLDGVDAFENKFIIRGPVFNREYVVSPSDSQSYFGGQRIVPDSDHFSIAKPIGATHPSHRLLAEFTEVRFKKIVVADLDARKTALAGDANVIVTTRDTDWGGQCIVFAFDRLPKQFALGSIRLNIKGASVLGPTGGPQAATILTRSVNAELPATLFATREPIDVDVRVQAERDGDAFYVDYCPTLDRQGTQGTLTVTPTFLTPARVPIENLRVISGKDKAGTVTFALSRPRNLEPKTIGSDVTRLVK